MAGVFLGYCETVGADGGMADFEMIQLSDIPNKTTALRMERRAWQARAGRRIAGKLTVPRMGAQVQFPSTTRAAVLEVEVSQGRVSRVRWMGKEVVELVGGLADRIFQDRIGGLKLGIVNGDGTTWLRNATITQREKVDNG
jgi:hypothetical protein